MTPCEKLGYKVGDEFEVHTDGALFEEGDVIVLFGDDGTDYPKFYKGGKDGTGFIHLSRVRPLTITLRPGDYVSADGMTDADYHAVAAAFMAAGAGKHEYPDIIQMRRYGAFGWSVSSSGLLHAGGPSISLDGRHLTISQVLNATNAPGKTPQQGPKAMSSKDGEKLGVKRTVTIDIAGLNAKPQKETTPMTVIDTLREAKRQRDEAAEKLETAEAVLAAALDAVQTDLGMGFELSLAGVKPAEDMNDSGNWRVGDVVRATEHSIDITAGREYVIAGMDHDGDIQIQDDAGDVEARYSENFTFIRRP